VRSVQVLGVRVDCVDVEGALAAIESLVRQGGPARLVATVNPEFVMRARGDQALQHALDEAALCVPDGTGVVWAMRRQGCRGQSRVAGSDLVPLVCQLCARHGWRPFLLGARPGVAAEAARRLEQLVPGLVVAGTHAGSPGPEGDEETLQRIRAARPDVLLVAYGNPKQELWVARNRDRLEVPVAIGVGGSLDFVAGRARRAPRLVRRVRLEWLWRLAMEPWRIRRMAVLPIYAVEILKSSNGPRLR
jgi:N-acetylglucosaminyldiphosphoundecaprenol N-acetyl-beta-D-mannosaminyltransferase